MITFSLLASKSPPELTKRYELDESGIFVTGKAAAHMTAGVIARKQIKQLADLVPNFVKRKSRHDWALCCGVSEHEMAHVVTKSAVTTTTSELPVIARTGEHIKWHPGPALVAIDYDPPKGSKAMTLPEFHAELIETCPFLRGVGVVLFASTSSCIRYAGTEAYLRGLSGIHAYLAISNGLETPACMDAIFQYTFAKHGYAMITKSGAIHPRTLIDISTKQPERIMFEAPAIMVSPEIEQCRPEPLVIDGDVLDAASIPACPDMKVWKRTSAAWELRRADATPEAARVHALWRQQRIAAHKARNPETPDETITETLHRAFHDNVLADDFLVTLADGRTVTVAEIQINIDAYAGKEIPDPIEPEYKCGARVAMIHRSGIHSYAHGETDYTFAERKVASTFDDVALLPECLRQYVRDTHFEMCSPVEYGAVSIIVGIGALIGTRCGIRPKRHSDFVFVPNLWGAMIGPPSDGKTPTSKKARAAITALIKQRVAEAKAQEKQHAAAKRRYELENAALKKALKADPGNEELIQKMCDLVAPETVPMRCYRVNEVTVEMLQEILRDNPIGVELFRDELVGLLSSFEKRGHEMARAFYLEAFNGTNSYTKGTKTDGMLHIETACLSLLGGMQPDLLREYLNQTNDGFLQRFQMLVYPNEQTWEFRDVETDREATERVCTLVRRIDDYAYGTLASPGNPVPYLSFDESGYEIYKQWLTRQNAYVKLQRGMLAEHMHKMTRTMPALALIFHVIDCADKGLDYLPPVSGEAASRAVAWCDFLTPHAIKAYALKTGAATMCPQAARLWYRIERKDLALPFTLRDLQRRAFAGLTAREDIELALGDLIKHQRLRSSTKGKRVLYDAHWDNS